MFRINIKFLVVAVVLAGLAVAGSVQAYGFYGDSTPPLTDLSVSTPVISQLSVSCTGSPTTINQGGTVTWHASATGGNGTYSYSWVGNGAFPTGATGNTVNVVYPGGAGQRNANVTVTSAGQTATATCSVQVVDGTGNPAPAGCTALQYGQVTLNGNSASVQVSNPNAASSNCSAQVGLVSFDTPVSYQGSNRQAFLSAQTVHDSRLVTIAPGTNNQTLTVSIPACEFQVDLFKGTFVPSAVQLDTAAGVQILTWKVSSGISTDPSYQCAVTPPVTLSCRANTPTVSVGGTASFTATGGSGAYNWNSDGGSPLSGSGSTFYSTYLVAGTKNVTVTSGGQTASCPVAVYQTTVNNPPACSPSNQTVDINQTATFSATGGSNGFSWSVNGGGSPANGSGSGFATTFSTAGTKTVTLTSGGQSDQCIVTVRPPQQVPPPACSPSTQNANVGDPVTFSATGGDGTFSWSVSNGTPSLGSASTFTTHFSNAGTYSVNLTSHGQTTQCTVHVTQVQQNAPACSPSNQTAQIGTSVAFSATGGNGSFSWTANTGSPTNGNGSGFSTIFNAAGTHIVTVTSNGLSDQCTVTVQQQNNQQLSCSASASTVAPGTYVNFTATGGNGSYNWNTSTGNPGYGSGTNFNSQFYNQGFQTVTVTSGGQTAQCGVTVQQSYNPQYPTCTASSQTVGINQQVSFYGSGGTGNYSWNAYSGNPTYGYGSSFSTSFSQPGLQTVTLNSNGQTSQCTVNVQQTIPNGLVCTPTVQNAQVNDFVTFSVSGGNGNYFWNTSNDGSPTTGSGTSFGTRFGSAGTKIVTVNSNGQTSQCTVLIGAVLGASTVDTGPEDGAALAAGIGLLGAAGAYGFVFRKSALQLLAKATTLIRR